MQAWAKLATEAWQVLAGKKSPCLYGTLTLSDGRVKAFEGVTSAKFEEQSNGALFRIQHAHGFAYYLAEDVRAFEAAVPLALEDEEDGELLDPEYPGLFLEDSHGGD